ncbi:MAG: CHAT domain-containing protein [Pyrinomonadaceae bacterium]|nr:CHAT domain-containing protein [Pyrinomonadaceae bacterium]
MANASNPEATTYPSVRRSRKSSLSTAINLLLLLLTCATAAYAQSAAVKDNAADSAVLALEPDKPIERELSGGESHAYQFTLAAGQYARVDVIQRRINLSLSALDYEGKKIVEADMFGIGETEWIALVSEASASTTYRLVVRSTDKTAPKGGYEIKVQEMRAANGQDKNLIAAERLVAEGILIGRQTTADAPQKAIEKYQQSIPLCQAAKNPAWEATALYLISYTYITLGDKQKALDFANQALPISQLAAKQPDKDQRSVGLKVEANALETMGQIYIEFGDKKKALDLFNQALPLRREVGDRVGEVSTLNNIGMSYGYMGDWSKALDFFDQARTIVRELGDQRKEASLLNNMCVIRSDLGEYRKALGLCEQALSIRRSLNDRQSEATVLNNMGNSYANLGEYQKALDLYMQALMIHKSGNNPQNLGIALSNVGWLYATLGEHQKAIDFYNEALSIFRAAGDQYREANVLGNIAATYADMKDFRKALEINQQVLVLRRAVNNRAGEAITLNNIAGCYSNLGDKQKALDYYNQSLAIHRAVGDPRHLSTTLRNIGALYKDMGDIQKALAFFNEGLQMTRATGDRNNEAGILAHIARLERDRGNLTEARKIIEEALAAVESLRINIKSQALRASFFASVRSYQELNIDLLMRLNKQRPSEGFDAAALQASERARARSLLELLTEAGAEIRQGVEASLLERERALRQSISDKADRQTRLLSGKYTPEQAAAAAKEIDALMTEYEQVQAQIRQTSPRYAALTRPTPLSLKEIQTDVLDGETLLLEYSLGEEKSFMWAVTQGSIQSFELPKRAEIESAARHVYELLTARNQTVANETPEQRRTRIEQAEAEYPKASLALSRMLLGPVAAELKNRRLVIVGDGLLQYTAFAALPAPDARTDTPATPLIAEREIVTLPSASVLAVLRREAAGRKRADKTLAVFADPVFDKDDPRIKLLGKGPGAAAAVAANSPMDVVKRSASESGLQDFVRLRFSRQEADQIVRLAGSAQKLEAVDFEANRAVVTSPELARYQIVHFATHGLINNQHPELSGVVLSLVDQEGRPQNGFLRLYDIYNLKLGADLVVVSACQTALGKDIKGEGLVGLTRGFMYAGVPRVVASLWQIDDRATAELMRRFYEGMLGKGLRPSAALSAAQASMAKDKRWQSPYYWAAFTLQGEWK